MRFPNPFTFLKAIWRYLRRPKDVPRVVPDKVRVDRLYQCSKCPHLDHGQCQLCTCAVQLKVLMPTESCPDKPPRWRQFQSPSRPGV